MGMGTDEGEGEREVHGLINKALKLSFPKQGQSGGPFRVRREYS
jgi:hypothetical protein